MSTPKSLSLSCSLPTTDRPQLTRQPGAAVAGQLLRPAALYLLVVVTVVSTKSSSLRTRYSSSGSLYAALCTPSTCRNGQCYAVNKTVRCHCEPMFGGPRCERVDLTEVSLAVVGGVAIVRWPRPPRLAGYSFVYYEPADPGGLRLYKNDIRMAHDERVALVGHLRRATAAGGHAATYRICVEDRDVADAAVSRNAVELLTNCVSLSAEPDYQTLVGWTIAALLAAVAVLLVYWQKDKFELLYFSKPVFLMYEHKQLDVTGDSKPS